MAIRFRRLDEYNFVRESERTSPDKLPGGKPNPRAREKSWEIDGYYHRLDWMLKAALRAGITGNNIKELAVSLAGSEKNVLDALEDAIRTGSLSMMAVEAKKAVQGERMKERWAAKKAQEEA